MIALIQRVSSAGVSINGQEKASIDRGLLVLLGIEGDDTAKDVEWLTSKVVNLRIFSDSDGLMNLSVKDIDGEILVVSQFTLHASTKKGNRPSFIKAARPDVAIPLYDKFLETTTKLLGKDTRAGEFGADMQVGLVNDGPVTIYIDSQNRV